MATGRKSGGRKYGRKASKKVARAMHEYKRGKLKAGSGRHPKAKSRKQAIAIGLSEARREGDKVPPRKRSRRKSSGSRKRSSARKSGSRKRSSSSRKKTSSRKSSRRKSSSRSSR